MSGIPDITIIGGGVIGLLTAREFSLAGAQVTIIEKQQLARKASWAGGGILLPLYPWRQNPAITTLVLQSLKLYPGLTQELLQATGVDPEWTDCGLLITRNPDIEKAIDWCQNCKIKFETPENHEMARYHTEPLNPLWLPEIAQTRNPRLLKALIKDLKQRRVTFIEHCSTLEIRRKHNRVNTLITSTGNYPINHLVLSAGAWSSQFWSKLLSDTGKNPTAITPVKGQMLLFDSVPELLSCMVLNNDQYLIPRRDGKILAGSTVEAQGFNDSTTPEARHALASFALGLIPELEQYPQTYHWAGLRPGTEHGIPYIDHHPQYENCSINAGHFRNGLVMGPASAKLMVDLILNRPSSFDPDPYKLNALH